MDGERTLPLENVTVFNFPPGWRPGDAWPGDVAAGQFVDVRWSDGKWHILPETFDED